MRWAELLRRNDQNKYEDSQSDNECGFHPRNETIEINENLLLNSNPKCVQYEGT